MTQHKKNPFSKYAATSNSNHDSNTQNSIVSNNGWMSTKKRGRDDDQIARDSQKALEEKRKRNARGRRTVRNTSSVSSLSSLPKHKENRDKRNRRMRNYKDDSFIASDESEVEEIQESENEEEIEEEFVGEESDDDHYDDDDDDDAEDDDLNENYSDEEDEEEEEEVEFEDEEDHENMKERVATTSGRSTSRNDRRVARLKSARMIKRNQSSLSTTTTTTTTTTKVSHHGRKQKTPSLTSVIDLYSSDDLDERVEELVDDDDDDEEEAEIGRVTSTTRKMGASRVSRNRKIATNATVTATAAATDTKSNHAMGERVSKFFQKKKNDDEIKELLSSPQLFRVKTKSKKAAKSFLSDSDEDETILLDRNAVDPREKQGVKNQVVVKDPKNVIPKGELYDTDMDDNDDDGDDELHEAMALSKAIEESLKDAEKSRKSNLDGNNGDDNDEDEVEIGCSDEEDQEQDLEEADEYMDEKEIEASNVLAAANDLCSRIIATMATWFDGSGADISDALIVDGALALSTLKQSQEQNQKQEQKQEQHVSINTENHSSFPSFQKNNVQMQKWISGQEMKQVCPEISLKDYQLIGVNWLALLHSLTFDVPDKSNDFRNGTGTGTKRGGNGRNVNGVLADEMGLGKTAQTIAFLAWLKYGRYKNMVRGTDVEVIDVDASDDDMVLQHGESVQDHKPHLIVVPASVLENWQREFQKFCPTMNIIKYHGSQAERQEIKNTLREYLPKKKGPIKIGRFQKQLDAVLTTFSYFSSEKSDDRSFLRKFQWNYMVVDEAHCLKNPKGKAYRNLDAFQTDRRLLLTGTPVQNSPKELMSLLCFLMPLFSREASVFDDEGKNDGGARMLEYFVRLEATGSNKGKNTPLSNEEAYVKLKQLLAPFVLRRRKDEVLGQWLPPKKRVVEWVPFDKSTRLVYDSILAKHVQSSSESMTILNNTHVFSSLRKAANHVLLLRTRHVTSEAVEHLSEKLYAYGYFGRDATCTISLVKKQLEKFSDYDIHCAAATLIEENNSRKTELERYLLMEEDLYCSPKFKRLKELLPQLVEDGHRMLIFSQWTRCLDLLGCLMDAMNFRFLRLDGQTSISERQQLIDQYTNDTSIPVFLLSTRAGGLGINLTAADTCILHDLDFNPFNDIQAEDRVHRIGQKKTVTIIKMITENTVDADIYKMQERKAEMNAAILESKKSNTLTKTEENDEMNAILKMAVSRFQTT